MARMKFLCDTKRCIECKRLCHPHVRTKTTIALEWGIQRRRVVTLNDGEPGEKLDFRSVHALYGCAMYGGVSGGLLCAYRRRDRAAQQRSVYRLWLLPVCVSVWRATVFRNNRHSVNAARWTNVPSAPAVPKLSPVLRKSVRNMAPTVLLKASCPCVPLCAQPKH